MLYNGHVINPDPYLLPNYKLSPFANSDIAVNSNLPVADSCDQYFKDKHGSSFFKYTMNGRKALNIALGELHLQENEIVSIITTTQNFYISSCVTNEIEKFCKWNREVVEETKAILINHEFGLPYEKLIDLKRLNIPIIEDCAYSFNSNDRHLSVGTVGDYLVYSFPKFFPIQIGGLLVSKKELNAERGMSFDEESYLKSVLSHYIPFINPISKSRRNNYSYLKGRFEEIGLPSRFGELEDSAVPGVFMFELPTHLNALDLKKFLYQNGVECSVFYGEQSLFIPCHHRLTTSDLDYFISLVDFYLNQNN
ncbi:DegT/DnrJ/EryC1/StrS family aminotransferase [Pedobacter sp.]|jgi:dTDP-4-amino-4,6-dideoxygalactose transaminase|uniref:DegT/DnrJ/EryC1/StrS family aminotransferase n=1 Tax=Pedobacter sp. TaxID=1411316 RepID=UPI002BCC454F|nr:DegT/DnrJ/EryC1/StrS family aminotransferase [Pedobacter sp.]HWW41761.1 DegT/DnrJ/EryC1/StrS family aminotransferase [Pedobacter sp.]